MGKQYKHPSGAVGEFRQVKRTYMPEMDENPNYRLPLEKGWSRVEVKITRAGAHYKEGEWVTWDINLETGQVKR